MGNFTNIIIICATIGLVAGLVVMMAQSISAEAGVSYDAQFFGDYVFSEYDLSTQYINASSSSTDWYVVKTSLNDSDLPAQTTTGSATSSSGFQFPDWLKSGWTWFTSPITSVINGVTTPVRMFLNVVGIPYTIIKTLNLGSQTTAILAGYFSVIFMIVFVMFLLGREN